MPFLKNIAIEIAEKHGKDLSSLTIILPTQRAIRYFKEHLAGQYEEAVMFPELVTLEQFIYKLTKQLPTDKMQLLKTFHDVWLSEAERLWTLREFLEVAPKLLSDFDHIDKNRQPGEEIFSQLEAEKSIERWGEEFSETSFDLGSTSNDYFNFWALVKRAYISFKSICLESGFQSQGMIYRKAAEMVVTKSDGISNQIYYGGFNSLTRAEQDVLFGLTDRGIAKGFWDLHESYLLDEDEEAGFYLRLYENRFGTLDSKTSTRGQGPNVEIVPVTGNAHQAETAVHFVQEVLLQNPAEKWIDHNRFLAVILPDESMLFPLLEALPKNFSDQAGLIHPTEKLINITMGVGFQGSGIQRFLMSLWEFWEKSGEKIYYKEILGIVKHPVFLSLETGPDFSKRLAKQIHEQGLLFLGDKEFSKLKVDPGILSLLVFPRRNKSIDQWMQKTKELVLKLDHEGSQKLNEHLANRFIEEMEKVKKLFSGNDTLDISSFKSLVFDRMKQVRIPFQGEPLCPIQIMGILESRTLDFDHVIVLSCNEGVLPKGKVSNSLLPISIRKQFDLPTYFEFDAASAYSFSRLFHEVKDIKLLYNNDGGDELAVSSPSRYLLQLEYLQRKPEPRVEFNNSSSHYISGDKEKVLEVQKTKEIQNATIEFLRPKRGSNGIVFGGLSPSSLNLFLKNPLQFYERKILAIPEPEELNSHLDQREFGNLVHNTLEYLFYQYQGQTIDREVLQGISSSKTLIPNAFNKAVKSVIKEERHLVGYNEVLVGIAENLVREYIKKLSSKDDFLLFSVEKKLSAQLSLKIDALNQSINVNLNGRVDRIDLIDGAVRIVDYKTGRPDRGKLSSKSESEFLWDGGKERIIQLLFYKYLFLRMLKDCPEELNWKGEVEFEKLKIEPYLSFFRDGISTLYCSQNVLTEPQENQEYLEWFESILKVILEKMFQVDSPFKEEPAFSS